MKITKLQSGGYLNYEPLPMIPEQAAPQAAPQEDTKPKDEGLDQDVLKKMIGEGITTDVMQYSQQVNQAYQRYSMMDDNMKNSYAGRQLRQVMKGDLGQLNALWRGKKMLDASIEQAKSNDGLGELAVTNDSVVVKDQQTGGITTLTFAQYSKAGKEGRFKALTNAELAEEREYNPQLLGNKAVFSIIGYAKGMDKIREEVTKIASTIGSSSISKSTGAFGGEAQGENASDILEQAAANGAFKIKDGITSTTNVPQIKAAQRALWNSLSDSSKAVLRARAALQVKDPSLIEAGAYNIAADLLNPHESTITREVHDETFKKMGGAGANGKLADVGPAESAFLGRYNNSTISIKGPGGATIDMAADLLPSALTMGKDGKRTTLREAASLIGVTDGLKDAFTVNGDKVKPENTVITGSAKIAEVPVIYDQEKGRFKVDEEGAAKLAKANKAFSALPENEKTDENKLAIMRKFGANSLNLKRMVIAEATSYADHSSWFDNRDSRYYDKADSDTEKYVGDIVDPKETGPRAWKDNAVHNHLILIPAGSLQQFREADGNHAKFSESAFDLHTYNTGPGGATEHDRTFGGPTQVTAPATLSSDYWKK
jgi:hypothetical protein